MSEDKKELSFEEAMSQLEKRVDRLESEPVSLEEAISLFKEGMELSKACHDKLSFFQENIFTLFSNEGEVEEKAIEFKDAKE